MAANELDVRQLRKPDKHPTIFATYAALPVGESFVLVNNHDPSTCTTNSRPTTRAATTGNTSTKAPPSGESESANSPTPDPRCAVATRS
jgi:hypothetical protein